MDAKSTMVTAYSVKRLQWLASLKGDDRHAITGQLGWMAWDATVFEIVNTARGMAPRDTDGALQINSMVHHLFNKGFFQSQMVAIRRLADGGYKFDDKKRGVWSLVSLLDDMLVHQLALSRSAILEAEGLFYDYEPHETRWYECYMEHHRTGKWPNDTPNLNRIRQSEDRHRHIDRFAGIDHDRRSLEDRIPPRVFQTLKRRVGIASKDVSAHVDKFIAHSASPESRQSTNVDAIRLTLQHIEDAHRALCEVASFLAIYVLGDAMPGYLATPQYDQFAHIERPLVSKADLPKIESVWLRLRDQYQGWSQWTLEEFENYLRSEYNADDHRQTNF
jgi:hypothetical protein